MRKYLDPENYVRRALSVANKYLLSLTETVLMPIADLSLSNSPIFVIGPPRSGSTLVFQVLTDAFDIGYISNRHCQWFGMPALAERLCHHTINRPRSNYRSIQGATLGAHEPSECGAWWYRFFQRKPAYVTLKDVSPRKMRTFRYSIAALERASRRPLIFKNLYATLRLEPMAKYLPEAIYVIIERNWVDNSQSILKGRKDALGRYDLWWSVPPPDVDELAKLPPAQQVAGQIASIHHLIDRDIGRLGLRDRTFRISYEDFCKDVHGSLENFKAFMIRHGVELQPRFDVPTSFAVDRSIKIPEAMYQEVVAEVRARKESLEQAG